MTTPRIEEILKELWELMPDDVARGGNETFYDTQIEPKLRRALTQAHQAGMDEERERINQYFAAYADYDTETECVIIHDRTYHKALQDKK